MYDLPTIKRVLEMSCGKKLVAQLPKALETARLIVGTISDTESNRGAARSVTS